MPTSIAHEQENMNMPQAAFAIVDLIPDQPAGDRLTDASEAPELARVLFEASPADAKAFALSMHERAAWGQNVDLIELWSGVVMELTHIAGASRPALLSV
jgi:hypothetical protein